MNAVEAGPSVAGYCPPEQAAVRDRSSSLLAGKFALGMMLSTAVMAAKTAITIEYPINAALPVAVEAEPRAVIATVPRAKPAEHIGKITSLAAGLHAQAPAQQKINVPELVLGHKIELVEPYKVRPNAGINWVKVTTGPDGLYEGDFNKSDQAQVVATTVGEDLKGKVYLFMGVKMHRQGEKPFWKCAWGESGDVTKLKGADAHKVIPNPCAKQIGRDADPFSIGHDYNCAPGRCSGGTYFTPLTPECDGKLFRNNEAIDSLTAGKSVEYARSIKHPLYDLKTIDRVSTFTHFRFRPLDDQSINTMSDKFNWVYMDGDCARDHLKGGPPLNPIR